MERRQTVNAEQPNSPRFYPGQIVRYARPETGEESLTFIVIEDCGDRVLIESRDFPNWRIPPRETVASNEIVSDQTDDQ